MTRRDSLAVTGLSVAVVAAALLESGGPLWLGLVAMSGLIVVWGCWR